MSPPEQPTLLEIKTEKGQSMAYAEIEFSVARAVVITAW